MRTVERRVKAPVPHLFVFRRYSAASGAAATGRHLNRGFLAASVSSSRRIGAWNGAPLKRSFLRPLSPAGRPPLPGHKKEAPSDLSIGRGYIPGDDLLSQDLSSHYHRRCGVSLPGSEWGRVVPPRSGHQRAMLGVFRRLPSDSRTGSLGN